MHQIFLYFIMFIHLIFILFVIFVPFTNSNYLLLLHSIIIPFIMLHWVTNENICALTLVEKKIRTQLYGEDNADDCFTCRLIEPIYDFKKNYAAYTIFIYLFTTGLWLISVTKLYLKYHNGQITSFMDLFK